MTLKQLEKQNRKMFLVLRDNAVSSILAKYLEESQRIGAGVAQYSGGNVNDILTRIDQEMLESIPEVSYIYGLQSERMANQGTSDVSRILTHKGIDLSIEYLEELGRLVDQTRGQIMVSGSPLDGKTISDKVWSDDKRLKVLQESRKMLEEDKDIFSLAEKLTKYLQTGQPYSSAYRLAHTEMVWAYETTKLSSIRYANTQGYPFEIAVVQELSPTHRKYDICDVLAGTYSVNEKVPAIPRHPNCNCIQRQIIVDKKTARGLTDYKRQLEIYQQEIDDGKADLRTVTLL